MTALICVLVLSLVQESTASSMIDSPENVAKFYEGTWTKNSAKFSRDPKQTKDFYYYEAIEINVSQMGTYTFTSKSSVNTYGYIYDNNFDPKNTKLNLISQDDGKSRKGQFKIIADLQPDHKYILIVTTSSPKVIGNFSIILFGPTAVNIVSQIKSNVFASRQIVSTPAPFSIKYPGGFFASGPVFHRPDDDDEDHFFYYVAIQISVNTPGEYTFSSDSEIDTFGYLYGDSFDPAIPSNNLITEDDDDGDIMLQFRLSSYLTPGRIFVLVVTSHSDCEIGNFTIDAFGPSSMTLTKIIPTPSQPITGSCIPTDLQSTYSGSLSTSNQLFYRPGGDTEEPYYFQAIQVTVATVGTYMFTCESELDTFGLLYNTTFDPSQPSTNLIYRDDDSGDDYLQFEIRQYLKPELTYILVVTTHETYATGSFSVLAHGPALINLSPVTPSTSQPIVTPTTHPPPMVAYTGALSSSSQAYIRPDGNAEKFYYLQAIQVTVSMDGTYIFSTDSQIDTMGFFYNATFDASDPTQNLITEDDDDGDINLQFRLQVYLTANQSYVLVVTTNREYETGTFSILARGPALPVLNSITASTSQTIILPTTTPTVSSSYSGVLTYSNSIFYRPDGEENRYNYFQAIRVTASVPGNYILMSDSRIDTVGYLYLNSFDPSTPRLNLFIEDDDDGDAPLQFRVQAYLQPGQTYILVVTTHRPYDVGRYSVRAVGAASLTLTSYYPSTSQPISTLSTPPPLSSEYSSQLSTSSQIYYRPDGGSNVYYYFQALRLTVPRSGFYSFRSSSPVDTRGYIYGFSFDPSNPLLNLLMDNDDGGSALQFLLHIYLRADQTYILVVTTHREFVTGNFSVKVDGLAPITLTQITPATSRPITTQATTPIIPTSSSGELSTSSPIFYRPGSPGPEFYYFQAFQVTATLPGEYKFTTSSSFDTRGYFYQTSFDPSDPTVNLMVQDDDSGTGLQFRIQAYLQAGQTYVLVVTTHREYITGNFSVLATGPTTLTINTITPSTSRPITTQPTTTTVPSAYEGALSISSQSYNRPYGISGRTYYFQAVQVTATVAGTYTFRSISSIDTRGYFYQTYFDAANPTENLLEDNDDGGTMQQFLIRVYLQAQKPYVLVVTTHRDSVVGGFSVQAGGPASVILISITPTTRPPSTTTTTINMVSSSYVNALVSTSPMFYRPNGDKKNYYYQAIEIAVGVSGSYTFSSNAYFDAIGYLYETSFNPYDPAANLMTYNDNCQLNSEFCITTLLSSERTYVIVVTTSQPSTTGLFWLRVLGPQGVDLATMAQKTSTTTNVPGSVTSSTLKGFASMKASPTMLTILAALTISILRLFQQ